MASADFKIAREEGREEGLVDETYQGPPLGREFYAGMSPTEADAYANAVNDARYPSTPCPVCKRPTNACDIGQPGSCTLDQIKAHYGRMERLQRAAR